MVKGLNPGQPAFLTWTVWSYYYYYLLFSFVILVFIIIFSVLTRLSIRNNIWPVKIEWRVVIVLSGTRCKLFEHGPADATTTPSSLASLKSRMVYFYVVLENRPLNGCHHYHNAVILVVATWLFIFCCCFIVYLVLCLLLLETCSIETEWLMLRHAARATSDCVYLSCVAQMTSTDGKRDCCWSILLFTTCFCRFYSCKLLLLAALVWFVASSYIVFSVHILCCHWRMQSHLCSLFIVLLT